MMAQPMRLFLYRLALRLGKTVRELSLTLTADELRGWIAYFQLEPYGEADNHRTAMLCSTIGNFSGNLKKGRRLSPADFMPKKDIPESLKQSEKWQRLMAITRGNMRGSY